MLFVPIRYRAELKKNSEIFVKAKISWLLRLLQVDISYKKAEKDIAVKFLGIKIYPKKEKKTTTQATAQATTQPTTQPTIQPATQPAGAETGAKSEEHPTERPAKQPEKRDTKKASEKASKKEKKSFNIKAVKEFFESEDNILGILQALNSIKRLLKHVLPGKISGYVRFGTGDPCTTGQILGLLAAFYGYYGRTMTIQPDFLEKCLETEVKIKGRIRIFTLLMVLLGLWFDKKFKLLIANFKKLKAEISA